MFGYDGGKAVYEGREVYWDTNRDGSINIFPDGPPSTSHTNIYHDKIIVEGAEVSKDFGGRYQITGGRETYKRINSLVLINDRVDW